VLSDLAADAAVRAWELLAGQPEEPLTAEEDLARRAARSDVAKLAASAGMSTQELERWAAAWREAGRGGLAAVRETWHPPRAQLIEARAELDDADLPGETKIWRNRLTRGDLQLRLGRDHLWYLFRHTRLGWLPTTPGSPHPLDTLA
jgi:hypothetical protein